MLDPLFHWIEVGGPVVAILILFSCIATTVALYKLLQFARAYSSPGGALGAQIDTLAGPDPEALHATLARSARARARVVHHTLGQLLHHPEALETARQEGLRCAREELERLGSYLRLLEVIATSAPLLGLLGTVLGMIEAFQAMQAAGREVDPANLSGGIWVALLTTAVGLAVAIPVSLLHSWFERRVERQAFAMHNDLDRLFTHWVSHPAQGPATTTTAPTHPPLTAPSREAPLHVA